MDPQPSPASPSAGSPATTQPATRLAAVGSTPDWTRPGKRRLDAGASLIDQGLPGAYGRWLYSQLDPVTHLEHFAHGPTILLESGQDDVHVPVEAAHRFVAALT
ncbi:MAG TPA: hypothetical protein VIK13_08020, partial [Candidatus Limnocylindrales bacterium]